MIMESTGMHKKKVVTSAIALTFAAIVSTQAAAQTDLQAPTPPQPLQVRPSALPAAPLATQASVPAASGTSVELQSVEITGNRNIDTATLLAALGDVKGRRLDAAGLKALTDRVTATYTAAGYVFASAFLPPQNLQNGVLRLTVIEGQYGRVRATSSDPALAAQAQAFLDHGLKTGAPIENRQLERSLLILDEQPSIRIRPVISPGARTGEGDLTVNVDRGSRVSGEVVVDNIGARTTGELRLGGNVSINSPFTLGDRIALSGLVTDERMWLGAIDYERPLGASGLRGQVGYAHTSYQLGAQFAELDAHGLAKVFSTRLSYPVLRSQASNLLVTAGLAHKELQDDFRANNVVQDKHSVTAKLGVQFDHRDRLLGGGITYGSLAYTHGKLSLDEALTVADHATARTQGSFDKVNLDVARIQQLSSSYSAYVRISGQWAGKNLDASEKFNLGGYYGVRAYPLGEGVGDRGWVAQTELRRSFGSVTPYAFFDWGTVRSNASAWSADSSQQRTIAGAGLGVRSLLGAWSVDGTLGWRTIGGASISDNRDRNPRAFVMVGHRF